MRPLSRASLPIAAALLVAGCGPSPTLERPPPASPAEAAVYQAQDALAAGFAGWPQPPAEAPLARGDGHEAYLRILANPIAQQGPQDDRYAPGSVLVALEHVAPEGPLARAAFMTRLDDGQWLYTALAADGTVLVSGTASEAGAGEACGQCHTMAAAGTDAVFTRRRPAQ